MIEAKHSYAMHSHGYANEPFCELVMYVCLHIIELPCRK